MNLRQTLLWSVAIFHALGAGSADGQPALKTGAMEEFAPLEVSWGVVDNYVGGQSYFESSMVLKNTGEEALGDDWNVYFNFIRRIRSDSLRGPISIRLVNGSFYELKPETGFELLPGDSVRIRIIASNWVIRKSAAPSGFYMVAKGGHPISMHNVRVEPMVAPRQVNRFEGDEWPLATARTRFEENRRVSVLPRGTYSPIVPTPAHYEMRPDTLILASPIRIQAEDRFADEAAFLQSELDEVFGLQSDIVTDGRADISLLSDAIPPPDARCSTGEAYSLVVGRENIELRGSDTSGVFYGIQSLIGLVDPSILGHSSDAIAIPRAAIQDCPRFAYRGLMIDVGRNFHPVERIRKAMRFMAFYKLNRLHFHLTEDEGWRLPVESLPELTEVGGRRGHTLESEKYLPPSFGSGPDPDRPPGSGHYTREQFVDLLRFAKARHIRVIPEIDSPGHMRAAVVSMLARYRRLSGAGLEEEARRFLLTDLEDSSAYRSVQGWDDNVVNVCIESAYRFMEVIVDELVGLFREAGAPLDVIHIGGDEVPKGVWEKSPACRRLIAEHDDIRGVEDLRPYFVRRVVALLEDRGLKGAGWEEIGLGTWIDGRFASETPKPGLAGKVIPYAWNSVWGWGGEERAYKLANAGYQVVMANVPNLYFDLAYEKHPDDPGFAWGGFVDERKSFELTPLHLYNSAYVDRLGRPIPDDQYRDAVRLTPDGKSNILGIQGQLWGENTPTNELFEYLLFPKMLALAERAWVQQPSWATVESRQERLEMLDRDWNLFANSLGHRELVTLARIFGGVGYRIPPPGAIVVDGRLEVNTAFPGLQLRYTTDGSEPDIDSPLWTHPVKVSGKIRIRAFDQTGRGGRSTSPD